MFGHRINSTVMWIYRSVKCTRELEKGEGGDECLEDKIAKQIFICYQRVRIWNLVNLKGEICMDLVTKHSNKRG